MWSSRWNENWQGKPKYSEKICPSATSSTTSPTWSHPGSNLGRRGGKPETNRLSYGTAPDPVGSNFVTILRIVALHSTVRSGYFIRNCLWYFFHEEYCAKEQYRIWPISVQNYISSLTMYFTTVRTVFAPISWTPNRAKYQRYRDKPASIRWQTVRRPAVDRRWWINLQPVGLKINLIPCISDS
jgi:hypothetical protein